MLYCNDNINASNQIHFCTNVCVVNLFVSHFDNGLETLEDVLKDAKYVFDETTSNEIKYAYRIDGLKTNYLGFYFFLNYSLLF